MTRERLFLIDRNEMFQITFGLRDYTYILAFHRISWFRSRTVLDSKHGLCSFFGTIRPSSSNLRPEEDNLCWASIIESWWLSLILRPLIIVSKMRNLDIQVWWKHIFWVKEWKTSIMGRGKHRFWLKSVKNIAKCVTSVII